jgi:transposase
LTPNADLQRARFFAVRWKIMLCAIIFEEPSRSATTAAAHSFQYGRAHALCNAHHLRELERAWEQDGQQWARQMNEFLRKANRAVHDAGGCLDATMAEQYKAQYRTLLREAENECPEPEQSKREGKMGRVARSKSRNLLERLQDFEANVPRFLDDPVVPFTNNQAENDLRMIKVQQKVSGCFRSMDGAKTFCRIRSYISTCRKQADGVRSLEIALSGQVASFYGMIAGSQSC